jgi:hypothetical protein
VTHISVDEEATFSEQKTINDAPAVHVDGFIVRRLRVVFVAALVTAGSSWVLFQRVDAAPFHGDESGWISSAIYYSRLVSDGDFSRDKWDCRSCKSWGALNAPLGKLLISTAYIDCDALKPCTFSGYYDFSVSLQDNQSRGQVPPRDVLRRGRYTATMAGVICCLLAFAIGYQTGRPRLLAGMLCAVLVLSNGIFRLSANRAMTDSFYNLFLFAQLLAAIALAKSSNERNMIAWLAVCGILTGLTASVKAAGFVVGLPLFVAVAAYRLAAGGGYKRTENGRSFLLGISTFVIASIAIIYLLNPTFWPSGRSDMWRLMGFPEMLLAWNRYMTFQDDVLGLGVWSGNRLIDIHQSIFVEYSNLPINVFFFVGLVVCIRSSLIAVRQGVCDVRIVPVVYSLGQYALLLGFLRLNWDRYYLPIELSMRVIAGIAMAALAQRAFSIGYSGLSRRST